MRRVWVIASASGNGKTTLSRALAAKLGVAHVELDALVHGPNWQEASDHELVAAVDPILAGDGWVIDGSYVRKLGTRVRDRADTIVWLDQPMIVWLPRLVRRTVRRLRGQEALWNGNRESWRALLPTRDSLIGYALRSHFRRRRELPRELQGFPVVRLRTPRDVANFLAMAR